MIGNKLRRVLSIYMALCLMLSTIMFTNVEAAVKDKNYSEYSIEIYNGDTWNYTFSSDDYWFGTANGNKVGNGTKYTKDYCTATKSGKQIKIKGSGSKSFSGDSQSQVIYLYKGKKEGVNANLLRKINVKIRKVSKPRLNNIAHTKNSSSETQATGITRDICIYVGDSVTASVVTSGGYDKFSWCFYSGGKEVSSIAGVSISSTTSKSISVKGNAAGTYTLRARVDSKYSSNNELSITNHVITKDIKVIVVKKPEIDVMSNGVSVTGISMASSDEIEVSCKMANVPANASCSISAVVNDNSKNYITLTSKSGTYILKTKEGFKEGAVAYFTYVLKITAGDTVSNYLIDTNKKQGTQVIKKTISVKLGAASTTYISLNGTKVYDDNIYITGKENFYPTCANAIKYTYNVEAPEIVSISSSAINATDKKFTNAFVPGSVKGSTKLTVSAITSSGIVRTKTYTIYNCDNAVELKANVIEMLSGEKKNASFYGVKAENVKTKKTTPLIIAQNKMSYTVLDPSIATIDKYGNVKALKVGSTTVNAKLNQSGTVSMQNYGIVNLNVLTTSFKVNVYEKITKVKFSTAKKTIIVGSKCYQKPENEPVNGFTKKTYTWSSSNNEIATVDSKGNVYGRKPGIVNITAQASDGSGKSASFQVCVLSKTTSNVRAKIQKKYIYISWNKISGSTYEIYRKTKDENEYSKIGEASTAWYKDSNVNYGKKYTYKIIVVPQAGKTYASNLSNNSKYKKYIPIKPLIKVKKKGKTLKIKIKGPKYDGYVVYVNKKPVATINGKSLSLNLKRGKKKIKVKAYVMQNGKAIYSKYSKNVTKKI